MKAEELLAALDRAIIEAPPAQRPGIMAGLASLQLHLAALALANTSADRWLTVPEAADLAQVPARRVRAWARRVGADWVTRPTPKTLRVHAARFSTWLASTCHQRSPNARNGRSRAVREPRDELLATVASQARG